MADEQVNEQDPPVSEAEVVPETKEELASLPVPVPKVALTPRQIRHIGALQVEDISDLALEQFLDQQRASYQEFSKADLVAALVDRDRILALEGRDLVQGKTGARLLREFVRGILSATDLEAGSRTERVERMLQQLGAEPADRRQLTKFGHTLGPGEDQLAQAEKRFHGTDEND